MPDMPVAVPVTPADSASGDNTNGVEKMAYPATEIDALLNKTIDFDFAERSKRYNAYAEQYLGNASLVSAMTSQMYSLNVQMVNAAALNQLPTGLGDKILGLNASAGQPFNSPGAPGSMNPAAPKAA